MSSFLLLPGCDWLGSGKTKKQAPERGGGNYRQIRGRGRLAGVPVTPLERYPVRARPRRKRGANYRDKGLLCKPESRFRQFSLIWTSTPAGSASFIRASTVLSVGFRMSMSRLWVRISYW